MVKGTLFGEKDNFRAQKVLVAAKFSGSDIALQENFDLKELAKKLPLGPNPGLEIQNADGSKKYLSQSLAIAYYVSNPALKREDCPLAQAEVLQWLYFGDHDLLPVIFNHVFPILGLLPAPKDTKVKQDLFKLLSVMNDHLQRQTFLVGERISLADISLCLNLVLLFERGLLMEDRNKFAHLLRWFDTIIHQKHVKDVLGSIKLCEKLELLPKEAVKEAEKSKGSFLNFYARFCVLFSSFPLVLV